MSLVFKNANVVSGHHCLKLDVLIKDGKIIKLGKDLSGNKTVDLKGKYLVPGFIDMHTHGIGGIDAMDGETNGVIEMSKKYMKKGVTSYLPTLLTNSTENIRTALASIKKAKELNETGAAEILGVHLEGPFFNPVYKGAQNEAYIIPGTIENFNALTEGYMDIVTMISLAPEMSDEELLVMLKQKGIIISAGHTDCTCEQFQNAVLNGLGHATHTYNAMKALAHREPGTVGGVFLEESVHAELILDGIHVDVRSAKILYRIKGSRKVNLVTDSMRAATLKDGEYDLGGQMVTVKGMEARLASGSLAGSMLTMDNAFKNAMNWLDITIGDAVMLTSTNAADEMGLKHKGRIAVGCDADLLVLNSSYDIESIYKAGYEVI